MWSFIKLKNSGAKISHFRANLLGKADMFNELRSMRRAISRRIDRALNFSASWIGRKSAESIEVTQRDDGVYQVTKGLSRRFAWRRGFRLRRLAEL